MSNKYLSDESFAFRLFRSFGISVALVSTIFTIFFVYNTYKTEKGKLIEEGKMLAVLLAQNARVGIFAENERLLADPVSGVMGQENVVAVSVSTADNRVLRAERKKIHAGGPTGKDGGSWKEGGADHRMVSSVEVSEEVKSIEVRAPVILHAPSDPDESLYFDIQQQGQDKIIGYVQVWMDKSALGREIMITLLRNALIALAFMLSGTIIIYLSVTRVIRPLNRLTEKVRSFGGREAVEAVPVETRDEIGRLAEAYNTMVENLRSREREKDLLEERLRLSQKMEAIGRFSRNIAHDFNNVLTTVLGSLFILKKRLSGDDTTVHYLEQMNTSLTKLQSLLKDLIAFSRSQKVELGPLEVNAVIRRTKPVLSGIVGERVELRVIPCEEPLTVMANMEQLEQVLVNLCTNARDAMPDGGVLTVETKKITLSPGGEPNKDEGAKKDYAGITISDTGIGMDEETKEKIFEPFFTTKTEGKGTGLGLSIVFGIVEHLGGGIDVETKAGEGTAFRISLPLV